MDGRVTRTLFRTVCSRGKPRQDYNFLKVPSAVLETVNDRLP
jgi:hypothetical protein